MDTPAPRRGGGFAAALAMARAIRPVWIALGLSAAYLGLTAVLAARRPLWNDELYTFHVSRLPDLASIWAALRTGAEQLPPLVYVATRASMALFGTRELAVRLPEVLGVLVLVLCLFRVVLRRSTPVYAALALLFPLASGAYRYAYEARPYGLVLGAAGLTLLAWLAAVEGERRRLALVGLGLGLAAATSLHYYAVLLLAPLALGEVVRSVRDRRVDRPVWVALLAGLVPLAPFWPLIQSARGYSHGFWSGGGWSGVAGAYDFLLEPARTSLDALLVLAVVVALGRALAPGTAGAAPSSLTLPWHEAAAAAGFVALPLAGLVVGQVSTGVLTARYVLPTVVGLALLFAWGADALFRGRGLPAVVLAVVTGLSILQFQADERFRIARDIADREATFAFLAPHVRDDLPIVVANQHAFVELAHYAPAGIAPRLAYLADAGAARDRLGHDTAERGLLELRHWARLDVQDYRAALAAGRPFLVYDVQGGRAAWLIEALKAAGVPAEVEAEKGRRILLLVRPRPT